jgi:hypothetical protein
VRSFGVGVARGDGLGCVGIPGIRPELTFGAAFNFGSAGNFGRTFKVFRFEGIAGKPAGRARPGLSGTRGIGKFGSAGEIFAALRREEAVLLTV